MKILDLPLKAKWYEMIESGNKKEEYREIKKYWIGRLAKCGGRNSYEKTGFYCKKAICFSCITRGNGFHPKEYTHVCFRFGYTKRTMLFELESFFPPSYIPQRFCKNKQYPYVEEVLEYVKEHTPDMFEPESGYACMSLFHGLCE